MAFISVELLSIEDNPHREPTAYIYSEDKIVELMESVADLDYWENILARKTKDGRIQIAYGHHRLQALKRLLAEGMTEFKTIKINVRPETQLTSEVMLKIFIQENKDTWGEIPQNLCMSILQVQAHLTGVLNASKDKDEFLKKIDAAGSLKLDDRAFTRIKNHGIGASIITQFLGDTWSRQTIQDALQVIKDDEATFKLAQNLPNVTLANRFQKLVTLEAATKKDEAVMADEETQRKVQDVILKNDLTRAEVEHAIKLSKAGDDPDPLGSVKVVAEKKKTDLKKAKDDLASARPGPKEPIEKIQIAFDKLMETIRKEKVNVWNKEDDMATIKVCVELLWDVINEEPPIADADDGEETVEGAEDVEAALASTE
jgi:hypothetical protein